MQRITIASLALALSLSAITLPARATVTPVFTAIDYPGANGTIINGVTRTGPTLQSAEMVGTYGDIKGTHGFILSNGAYTTLDAPVLYGTNTEAHGISSKHQIVGWYYNAGTGARSGFSYYGGTYTSLAQCSQPNYFLFEPSGINNAGLIVGTQNGSGSDNLFHSWGFVQGGSTCINFNLPNAQGTSIYGINNLNNSVGTFTDANSVVHGAAFSPPPYVVESTIDVPGALSTSAYGINDSGVIVGNCVVKKLYHIRGGFRTYIRRQGFVFADGVYTSIMFPGSFSTEVHGVNNPDPLTGTYQIVGSYVDYAGNTHGYMASISRITGTLSQRRHPVR